MIAQRMLLPALFEAQRDRAGFEYLKSLPPSLMLPADAADRLHAVAGEHLALDRRRLAGALFRSVIK